MGLIASSTYLAIFSSGTVLGAASAYFALHLQSKRRSPEINQGINGKLTRFEFKDPHGEYRVIMAIRNDLKMQKGKVAAQCGHAAVAAYAKGMKERPQTFKNWLRCGQPKIAVKVESEEEMLEIDKKAKEMNILSSIVRDAGQTQVAPGSRTVIAIGPAPKVLLDKITGHLKLF